MSSVIVFGAGGRAGRAITAEARERGYHVIAAMRARPGIPASGPIAWFRQTSRMRTPMPSLTHGHDAVVNAVSPADPRHHRTRVAVVH
jgi:putative NADH-flavin reductase